MCIRDSADPVRGHQVEVRFPQAVRVAGHVAGLTTDGASRCVAERVPDGGQSTVLGDRPFDLVRRRGCAEDEIVCESPTWLAIVRHRRLLTDLSAQPSERYAPRSG